jgi:antitoxin HicB
MADKEEKGLTYYVSLPFRIEIHPTAESGFVAAIPDLPGCITQGDTKEEVLQMIEGAKEAWIETALEEGIEIPEPVPNEDEFSGKFNLRIPRSLQRDLTRRAEREKVSLNMLATYLLSASMGKKLKMK